MSEENKNVKKEPIKVKFRTCIEIIIGIELGILIFLLLNNYFRNNDNQIDNVNEIIYQDEEVPSDIGKNNNLNSVGETTSNSSNSSNSEDYIFLCDGLEVKKEPGLYMIDNFSDGNMAINEQNEEKYNITYYNYENGKSTGTSKGKFGEETLVYDGVAQVENVAKYALSKEYNAMPRESKLIYNIPEKLKDLDKENGKVEINEIDLDGDGKKEHIVVASDYDVDAKFSTKIMLYDSEYTKIADLVNFENPYYKNEEDLTNYTVTSLSLAGNVECMDIDNDGNMEILIDIPIWEGKGQLSIVKYQNGKIQGEKEVTGSVRP